MKKALPVEKGCIRALRKLVDVKKASQDKLEMPLIFSRYLELVAI